jgi:hypothetical protein
MTDASLTTSRTPPPGIYLLAEHLDAALAAGEDLVRVYYAWDGPLPTETADIDTIRAGQRAAVEDMRTFEMALIARVLQARDWAAKLGADNDSLRPIARLFVSGSTSLIDAAVECGDSSALDFDTGGDVTAYLRGRGLIAPDAAALDDAAVIAADDAFLVARRIPLGVLLDLASAFLDSLEAQFDLFVSRTNETERAIDPLPPAPPR